MSKSHGLDLIINLTFDLIKQEIPRRHPLNAPRPLPPGPPRPSHPPEPTLTLPTPGMTCVTPVHLMTSLH